MNLSEYVIATHYEKIESTAFSIYLLSSAAKELKRAGLETNMVEFLIRVLIQDVLEREEE